MESVTCRAYVIDEYGESDEISGTVVVSNRQPTVPFGENFSENPQIRYDLHCSAFSEDVNGQLIHYSYQWFKMV